MKNDFIKVCKYAELKENTGKQFFINDLEIALFKVDGKIYALSNICPHQKTHLMHEGLIENGIVYCPIHGWSFLLSDGKFPDGSKGLDSYETKVIGDYVYVKVKEKIFKW